MAIIERPVYQCDICGQEWLSSDPPEQCVRCRSRRWNWGSCPPIPEEHSKVWQQERLAEAEKRAEKAEAERDSYSYLEAQIAALQSDEFANQMATNLGASVTRLAELVIERDKLRAALIEVGRNAGASLADTVSTEFLTGVPEEVKLVIDRLRQELEHLQAVAKERQTVLDAYQRREDPEEAYARGWADHLNYRSYSPRKEQ